MNSAICSPTTGLAAAGAVERLTQCSIKRGEDGPHPSSSVFYDCPLWNYVVLFFPGRNQGVATHLGQCNV